MSVHWRALPWQRAVSVVASAALVLAITGCSTSGATDGRDAEKAQPTELVLASTTSTQDSGLFDVLIPAFEADNPDYQVKVVAVGTGEALKLGESKDADVLLVHAKADEEKFVASGFGTVRRDVMFNDFLIVGPAQDPAGVKASADTTQAMLSIQKTGVGAAGLFVSRGDDSGTHKKELKLWSLAGVEPTPTPEADAWYLSTGQGMGETLKIASEKGAYTLVDRATFLTMKDSLDLEIVMGAASVAENSQKNLLNQYGVIPVTDARNADGAQAFADWITSEAGQKVIGDFGVDEYGQQLFSPNAE